MTLHTDIPTHTEVERLLAVRDGPCVSIYLATTPITPDADASRIELKNLGAAASNELEAAERSPADVASATRRP